MLSENIKNPEIREILDKYEHYGHMKWADLKAFREYRDELRKQIGFKDLTLNGSNTIKNQHFILLETEHKEIEYINKFNIYTSTLTSLYEMNGILRGLWDKECSGYGNNAFYDFKKLCEYINAYWEIETPHKAPNKIAYGWKFSMQKADCPNGYYSKSWKLYIWGCIKNYLIKNGVEFTKDESLKVRKIVGLVDVNDTVE